MFVANVSEANFVSIFTFVFASIEDLFVGLKTNNNVFICAVDCE